MHPTTLTSLITLGTSSIVALFSLSYYLNSRKKKLSTRISHSSKQGHISSSTPLNNIKSIPDEIFTSKYYVIYDSSSKSIPREQLPDLETGELLTRFLRRNMSMFASLTQGYVLYLRTIMMTAKDEVRARKKSFDPTHIRTLDFKEGDLVCNAYRVKVRSDERVEFGFESMGIEGRLVVGLEERGELMVFHNETFMWRESSEERILPLERGLGKWMHGLTAWWMLDSGVRDLVDLRGRL